MKTNKNSKDIEEFLDDIFKDVEEWDKTESDEEELDLDIDDELENIKAEEDEEEIESNDDSEEEKGKRRIKKFLLLVFGLTILTICHIWLNREDYFGETTTAPSESYCEDFPCDTAAIKRCINAKTGEMEYRGNVKYYVNEDTIFMSERFHFVDIIYTNNETGRIIPESGILSNSGFSSNQIVKQQKNGWWYATIKRSEYKPKEKYTVTAIVLRALYVEDSSDDICYDAYLYNVTPSITRDRTEGTPSKSVQKLLECLD